MTERVAVLLQRVETAALADEKPEVLWESED